MAAVMLFVIATATLFFIRECDHICIGDELRYFYRFQLRDGETYFRFDNIRLTESAADIADSMRNHYTHVNGRIPVHALEQAFSSLWGLTEFYAINACVLILTISLATRLCAAHGYRLRMVVLCTGVFLYLFPVPGRLWLSINLALNYLWPSCAMIALLLYLRRLLTGRPVRWPWLAATCVLAFLFGWSNEAFSFPVGGALAIWAWRNRRHTPPAVWTLATCLWAGAAVMACSPGNWHRAAAATDMLGTYLTILSELRLIWILAAVTAALYIIRLATGRDLTGGWKRSPLSGLLWTALALSLGFGLIAHTAARAMTCAELLSALLLLSLVPYGLPGRLSAIIGTLIIAHQCLVTAEHHRQYASICEASRRYTLSRDGTVTYDYREPSWLTRHFVYHQVPANRGAHYEWSLLGVYLSGSQAKPFTAITPQVADTLRHMPLMTPRIVDGCWTVRSKSPDSGRPRLVTHDGKRLDVRPTTFRLDSTYITMLRIPQGMSASVIARPG